MVEIGFDKKEVKDLKFYFGKGATTARRPATGDGSRSTRCLPINDEIRDLVVARAHAVDIRRKSIEMGMRTLRDSGLDKIRRGMTTIEEVLRVTGLD